ncbi:MAG: (Fe-S)-binding protein, partial [Thermoplasmata archaeon]|nr:(Fe-S)-binding protein [Thermoplasmata archaeon]
MAKEKISIWLGCTTRTYLKDTIKSLNKILMHLNLNYSIIESNGRGTDIVNELCCGSVLLNTGQRRQALANFKIVEKYLNRQKVRNLVAICPGCARTFLEFYLPRKTNPIKSVEHISQTFQNYLDDFEFRPKRARKTTRVTYNDPCHLGRHLEVYEPPRTVIKALPGVELIEMPTARAEAFCCGSGGGVRAFNKDLANFSSGLRVQEALGLEVEYLLTACPFCERSLR